MSHARPIRLRGVRVHNLKAIDLDLPLRQLVVVTGVSGSGKSSLAFDTLYAEGQRRYIESFSAYTRQFLERLQKPDADAIEGIPPAIAIGQQHPARSGRSTVATATEIHDHLRLLYACVGRICCPGCGREVRRDEPGDVATAAQRLPPGTRFLVGYPHEPSAEADLQELAQALKEEGFVRAVVDGRLVNLNFQLMPRPKDGAAYVVVDRLVAGAGDTARMTDSAETAFARGEGRCVLLVEASEVGGPRSGHQRGRAETQGRGDGGESQTRWQVLRAFNERLRCDACGRDFPEPEPRLFSFNSPLGACPPCEGFGSIAEIAIERVVPDPRKSLREGAIAPWNTPAYAHELEELLALAPDYGIPIDVPFGELSAEQRALIQHGVPERRFGGLDGFFRWLERRKYKMHIRVFLSRWRGYRPCPSCGGSRLRPDALAVRVAGRHLGEVGAMTVRAALAFFDALDAVGNGRPDAPATPLSVHERTVARVMLGQIRSRLRYLSDVGLGYLALDRQTRTLCGGEAQRVALTTALGSCLVNTLYVIDEPTVALHPRDTKALIDAMLRLRDRKNTLVVVEHDEAVMRAADQLVDLGPGAGDAGGRVVFQGPPDQILQAEGSLTGAYLARRRQIRVPQSRRAPEHGWLELRGARANNLKDLDVRFPLGVLCVVTGVSGSGKSSLVHETLYPALCRQLASPLAKEGPAGVNHVATRETAEGSVFRVQSSERPISSATLNRSELPLYDELVGAGQVDQVVLVDQTPPARSPRSNPVTYVKAFDEIRAIFAATSEARLRNYGPSMFSFNVEGGRCERCQGTGVIAIDMQFLADILVRCDQCGGTRYRPEVLDVKYRGRSIAEVLEMTVREALEFFRGRPKVQARLRVLKDVGLDYVRLGQPASTLSGGEAQRLKLAGHLAARGKGAGTRTVFLLDEPTTGLHFEDVLRLLDCFDSLLAVGHSLIVVEHNLDVAKCADWIIDLGPGAADEGGRLVAAGPPEDVARRADSVTGRYLAQVLAAAGRAAVGSNH